MARSWAKHRQMESLKDIALIGLATTMGIPMQEIMRDFDKTERQRTGAQEIGEFCGGTCITECRGTFGNALALACSTCPN